MCHFGYGEVGAYEQNFVIQMNCRITNFLLLVIFSEKSGVCAREAKKVDQS
jgi:hypothetical protein